MASGLHMFKTAVRVFSLVFRAKMSCQMMWPLAADVVFAVVLVPVVPVVPVVVVRLLLVPLPSAPWGYAPRCTRLQRRHRHHTPVSHCSLHYPFRYCLHSVTVFPGNTFPGPTRTISIYQRARGFEKFSPCGSAAICICCVVPCRL